MQTCRAQLSVSQKRASFPTQGPYLANFGDFLNFFLWLPQVLISQWSSCTAQITYQRAQKCLCYIRHVRNPRCTEMQHVSFSSYFLVQINTNHLPLL